MVRKISLARIGNLTSLLLDFRLGWCFVLGIGLLDNIWITQSPLHFSKPFSAFVIVTVFVYFKALYRVMIFSDLVVSKTIIKKGSLFFSGVEAVLLFLTAGQVMCILSYLTCSLGYPLVDEQLLPLDQAMGFDWKYMLHFSQAEPFVTVLRCAYNSFIFQILFFVGWFSFLRQKSTIYEMFWILAFSMCITTVLFGVLPVLGPAPTLGLGTPLAQIQPRFSSILSDVLAIRSGVDSSFTLRDLNGIIGFPSFHTITAFSMIYGFRKYKIIGRFILALNVIMLVSIPVFGNHYLMDMVGGFMVALIGITIGRRLSQRFDYKPTYLRYAA